MAHLSPLGFAGLERGRPMCNGELTPELREVLMHLVYYAGYPCVAGLVARVEKLIAEHASA